MTIPDLVLNRKRIALGLQYDGSLWHGWQVQPNFETIQSQLHLALQKFTKQKLKSTASGRTDSGVHALQQVIHFDVVNLNRQEYSWVRGVNAFLAPSIRVLWAREMSIDFHARFSAKTRRYIYILHQSPTSWPLFHQRVGWVIHPLNIEWINQALDLLRGRHDFTSFRSTDCQALSPIRTLSTASVSQRGSMFFFHFEAEGFLHNMVRNLMGALLLVGYGKRVPSWISEVLEGKDRRLGPATFMPDGLYFMGPTYDSEWKLPSVEIVDTFFAPFFAHTVS